jgi:hypothetical protein
MQRISAVLALALSGALCATTALAQPAGTTAEASRAVNTYVYMIDDAKNRVLVSTNFWRNDTKYDDRTLHRFLDILAALEKKGFRMDPKAVIDSWDKPAPYARCYVYLEDMQVAQKGKGGVTSGSRVWCSGAGISEAEVRQSDGQGHVGQVLQRFDLMLGKAKSGGK